MRIASLGSGSRGNATLVQYRDTTLLVDNGFSLKQFRRRLDRLDIEPDAINAVLLTHEHGDHSGGVERLCANHGITRSITSTLNLRNNAGDDSGGRLCCLVRFGTCRHYHG